MNKKQKTTLIRIIIIAIVIGGILFFIQSSNQPELPKEAICGESVEGCCGSGLDCYDDPNDATDLVGKCFEVGIPFASKMEQGDKCK